MSRAALYIFPSLSYGEQYCSTLSVLADLVAFPSSLHLPFISSTQLFCPSLPRSTPPTLSPTVVEQQTQHELYQQEYCMMAPLKPPQPQPTSHDLSCLSISDLHTLALDRMDKQTRDYYNEGSDDNSTLRENSDAYDKYRIRPRVLRDVSNLDTSVSIFGGIKNSVPFGVAPTAMQGLAHYDAEHGTARVCRDAGIVMGLSSFATTTLEDVRRESGQNCNVLQLYLFEDRKKSIRLIERAKKAGYKAVLLTVDTPMLGRRNQDMRNKFQLPAHLKVANFADDGTGEEEEDESVGSKYDANRGDTGDAEVEVEQDWQKPNVGRRRRPPIDIEQDWSSPNVGRKQQTTPSRPSPSHRPGSPSKPPPRQPKTKPSSSSIAGYHDGSQWNPPAGPITFHTHAANPTLSWEESIPWLKQVASPMQVWVKGILTPEDALLAIHHAVDGIIVSNHGGRQLNNAMATLGALPSIVEAVRQHAEDNKTQKIPVHVDGGIRHGTDIFKALCLGADFCWIGRPVLWGLAYKGEEGVRTCLRLLTEEVRLCMGLSGVKNVEGCGREFLVRRDGSRL